MTGRSTCSGAQARFAEYLDGRLTGREMQRIAEHLERCADCAREFGELRQVQAMLGSLGAVRGAAREPEDMPLRLRVAISRELAQSRVSRAARWRLAWSNSLGPFLLQLSAGFAGAVLLLGSVTILVGMFAGPDRASAASAQDEPLGMASAPKLRYLSSAVGQDRIDSQDGPVVVEAYVNGSGRVYDYRIVSGPTNDATRSQVEDMLLFSVFEPARFFGQPVRGLAVLSFSGVSVRG